jgi:hypothetical protein
MKIDLNEIQSLVEFEIKKKNIIKENEYLTKKAENIKKEIENEKKMSTEKVKAKELELKQVNDEIRNKATEDAIRAQQQKLSDSGQNPLQEDIDNYLSELEENQKKVYVVKFDTKTSNPFEVRFSERGFLIDDTRLSFEIIETALSKDLQITLKDGKGMVLDAVKMQKILKYKDKF